MRDIISSGTNDSEVNPGQVSPTPGYDLAVAYRIYPYVSKPARSLPFGNDKLAQAGCCLETFRKALGTLRVKLWVILDGCPSEFRLLFERTFASKDLNFVELNSAGNRATFTRQLDILLSQSDADFVYLAEDDYLYHPDSLAHALRFLRTTADNAFLSLYDHPDCYSLELHREPKWIRLFEGKHWRTASSTCLTFLTRKRTLARHQRAFRTYGRRNGDCALWLSLTKRRVFDPIAVLQCAAKGERYWREPAKAWLYCWPQVLFGRTAQLWVPVPGLATHLCQGLISPAYDWLSEMKGSNPHALCPPDATFKSAESPE